MTALERLKGILKERFCIADDVAESAGLIDDLGFDSLDLLELSMALEDEFGICIPDESYYDKCLTIGDVVRLVEAIAAYPRVSGDFSWAR